MIVAPQNYSALSFAKYVRLDNKFTAEQVTHDGADLQDRLIGKLARFSIQHLPIIFKTNDSGQACLAKIARGLRPAYQHLNADVADMTAHKTAIWLTSVAFSEFDEQIAKDILEGSEEEKPSVHGINIALKRGVVVVHQTKVWGRDNSINPPNPMAGLQTDLVANFGIEIEKGVSNGKFCAEIGLVKLNSPLIRGLPEFSLTFKQKILNLQNILLGGTGIDLWSTTEMDEYVLAKSRPVLRIPRTNRPKDATRGLGIARKTSGRSMPHYSELISNASPLASSEVP